MKSSAEKKKNKKAVFAAVIRLLGLFMVFRLGADALADIACSSGSAPALEAASRMGGNARVFYRLAVKSHYGMEKPDLQRAMGLYRRALARDPFYAAAWYQLALACRLAGYGREAGIAMANYARLRGTYAADLWNIGVFRLEAGQTEAAAKAFRRCLGLRPDCLAGVAGLFSLVGAPQSYMAEKVLPRTRQAYSGYMDYLLGSGRVRSALSFSRFFSGGLADRGSAASLCRMLIDGGDYGRAWGLWRKAESQATGQETKKTFLIDGGFERPIGRRRDACFGWMAPRGRGFFFKLSYGTAAGAAGPGGKSLHVAFKGGPGRGAFHLWQYIMVSPGMRYELSAGIRTQNVITAGGVYLQVWDQNKSCGGYCARSAQLRGTGGWRRLRLEFRAPQGCRMLKAGILRDAALALDPDAPSALWISGVRIKK